MQSFSSRSATRPRKAARIVNSMEALRGHTLAERALARQAELEAVLASMDSHVTVERASIEQALATLDVLLTGDVHNPAAVVARDLNNWLERSRYLGLSTSRIRRHA